MTTSAQSVVKACQVALNDLEGVRWSASDLVIALNDAQRDLVVARPDANPVVSAFVPVAGARQTLPASATVLIDVVRNSAGNKRSIRKVDASTLDAFNRDWRSAPGVTEFAHYCYDERDPRAFELYPPSAAAGASVELLHGAYPTDVPTPSGDGKAYTTVTGNLSVADQWQTAIYNYMLSRAYARDIESGGNVAMATAYMQAFTGLLGVQLQSSKAVAPQPKD
jgi:hypothetical protein